MRTYILHRPRVPTETKLKARTFSCRFCLDANGPRRFDQVNVGSKRDRCPNCHAAVDARVTPSFVDEISGRLIAGAEKRRVEIILGGYAP